MEAEELLISGTGKAASRKVPVFGVAIGVVETAKDGWKAKNAVGRALDAKLSERERITASRAATIYGRRAIFKAGSTVVAQIPVYGTVAALALDGAEAVLNLVEGDPNKVEKKASAKVVTKKKSTEAFMREMREQAAKENLRENNQALVRRKIPPCRIDARSPPFPFSAASAPGPKARSIQ